MYDIEAAIEARRIGCLRPTPAGEQEVWTYGNNHQLHRRWLALYRSEGWSMERIARLDQTTLARVWCGLMLALRDEPPNRRKRPA